ncbi:Nucleoprotein TPR [Oopsacas minuta]|uniref:Nucleoprotein TPR n=1 Tax=Oopsacas minuta TaxID=111878 RepID=A0AAV7JCM5_9METZ|nr:Nucleoprotein TPR [Oopsacas minuta]
MATVTASNPGPSSSGLTSSFKSQHFSDVSDSIHIGEFKRILFSYLREHTFKQGPISHRDNLCEEMGIDEPVLADIERICAVEGLKHREGDEMLKNLNLNTLDMIPNANDFSLFRLRTRRRETGSIWSKDSVNTVNKIAPIQEPIPMVPLNNDELILTVTVFHPILKKKDQEFLLLASQPIKALLDKLYCVMDYVAPEEFSLCPEKLKTLEGHNFNSSSAFFLIENTFYNDMSNPGAKDCSKIISKWATSKIHGRPRNPFASRTLPNEDHPTFTSKDMEGVRFEDLTIRMGYPYLFHHHGNCEHVFMIRDMRAAMEDDNPNASEYPLLTFKGKYRRRRCSICHVFTAKWLTCNDQLAFEHPSYFCDKCFMALHYSEDDRKLYTFQAYPHVDKSRACSNFCMSDNISVSSGSGTELEVIIPPEIRELPFPNQLSGMITNEWDEAVVLPTWIDDAPDTPEQQDTPPRMEESTSEADSASDSQSDKLQVDDEVDSTTDREDKSVSDYESDELSRHTSDRPLEGILGAPLEEMNTRITPLMEREKREIEAAAEERVKRYQRESEELQLALSTLRRENEQRHKLSQLSETDLISMVQRKDREISFLSEEAEKYTKRLSELSYAKLSEQSQLEKALKEDERLRLRESAIEQQREHAIKKNEWLEEELTQKCKDAIQMKSRLQEQICALEEDNGRNVKQLDELRIEFTQETEEKETLRFRLDTCLSDLESSRDERCIIEDRHRQEVAGQKKLASLYKESAEQSELKVSELLGKAELLQRAVTDREQSLRETELRISEEHALISSQREALQSRVGELETELRHANDMLEKAGVGRRGLFQCEGKTETITEIYSKYVEATNYIQDLEEVNARVKLNLETYKNSVNEKIPLMRRQKEENDYLKRNNKELHEHLERLSSQLESITSESDISIRRSRFLERENLKQSCTIRELNTQVCVLLKESEESRGVSITAFSMPADLTDAEVSSSSEGRIISFRSLEELQSRNVELLSKVREVEAELEQMKGVGQDERIRETQKKVAELTVVVEQVKESKRQQSEMIQSVIRDRDKYKSLLAQSTALPMESAFVATTTEQTSTELVEVQKLFDNHKRQSEDIRKQLIEELEVVKEAKSHLELEIDRLDSKLEFASERQELLKNWYESQRTESQTLREKNEQLLKHVSDMEQSARSMMQDQFQARDQLSRLEFQKESLEKKNEALKTSEEWSKNQIEVLLREKREQNLLKANIEMIQNSLERTEHENKLRTTQQVGLLEEELKHTRTQLEQKGKQHERVVEAWEKQVDELKTSLHTTHETQIQNVNLSNNQTAKIHDLESVLASTQKKVEQRERELVEARDNLKKAESGAIVMDLQEESSRMKLRVAELEQKCKAMENRVCKSNEHVEHYKTISEAAEHQIKENLETSETFRNEMESKLSERDERESELQAEVSDLERECRELRESIKQLETTHTTTLSNREIDLQYTKNLLKEAQANLALLEGKETMAREDVLLHERVSQETQDKYEREVIEHGKTVEVLCRSKDELSSLKLKLQVAEQEANQHLFKLEEGKQNWDELKLIGESRIEQLTIQLTDAQSQNKLLFSQLESINAKLITLQSDRNISTQSTEETHHTTSLLTLKESEDQLRELIRHIRREKEIVETKFELAESERVRLSETCKRYESELEETRTALAGEQEALRAQAETVAQHSQLLEKVNTLNLLQESNRVLREDKNSFEKKSNSLSGQLKEKVEELFSVKESNKTLTSQKETLLAEKTALKNEVARWQARVNQLLEVYDKMDPEEFRELQSLKEEHLTKISDLTDRVKQMDDERNEQKHRIKLLEDRLSQLLSESESTHDKHATELKEMSEKLSVKEEELKTKSENSKKFAQAARNWKTRFEEKNTKFQEIEKNLNELKTANLQEKSRSEEEWQERQQELTEKNQGLEVEKADIQQQLNETKAALEEKSRKVERMQDGLKKLNIRVRQQTKTLEEKVSTLKTENTQLKTANAEKEGQLQALKNQHQSQLSQLEAKFKLESSSKVSSTQPSPGHASIAPSKQVAAIKPSKLSITTNPTVVVNPICREQISVSISPFTSSVVTSSAQPSSSLPPIMPTVSSDWPQYPSESDNTPATNFNLSHVQLDLQTGVTTRSSSKRKREEAEAATTSTSDPQGKKNKVLTTPPPDTAQLPTSLADGTSVIDSSTTHSHSPNSTYGNPPPVIEESSSSHLQVVPSSMDDLLQPSAIYCELSPSNPASARSPPRLLLPPSFENFGEIEHAVPNTPILQPGNPISGHTSTGHSVPVPPDSSSINIASDEGLTNDHELDFDIGHDIIHTHGTSSQEDNLYGEFRNRVDVNIASPTRNLPFSSNADSPSSTPGPQVSTSTNNQNSSVSTRQEDLLGTDEIMLPETSEVPLLQTETEEPTSAADVITRIELPEPTEGVSCIEIPHELSYDQLSSSDEETLDREEHTTVVSSDDSESEVPYVIDEYDSREAKKGGSVESVSDGEIDDQLQPDIEIIDPSEPSGSLPESSSKTTQPRYIPITWGGTSPVTQPKSRRGLLPPDTLPPTSSKGTGHKGLKNPLKRPPK